MDRFVPKEKMSKKEKKRLAAEKRTVWAFPPVTRKIASKKVYDRKKISRTGRDDGGEFFFSVFEADGQKKTAGCRSGTYQIGDGPRGALSSPERRSAPGINLRCDLVNPGRPWYTEFTKI